MDRLKNVSASRIKDFLMMRINHTIRFDKEALNITIHNQYPNLELMSPVYCSNGATCHVSPSQKTTVGTTIEASFVTYSKQDYFKGALLYKLQRKYATRTDNQPNNSTASIDTTASMYFLMVWDVKDCNHKFCACLIELTDDFTWDEDRLWALYKEYNYEFYENYKSNIITWLMHGGVVMKTRFDVTYGSDYKLDIVISEGTGKYNMLKPTKIDPKRLVLLLLLMLIMLMYTVSFYIQQSFKLIVHNQCLNVGLVSPIYITDDDLECYRAPDDKVYAGDIMKSGFTINKSLSESNGALICKLQMNQLHESAETDEDTSSVTHLLVVWRISEFDELYADVLLVEHDKKLDKNNLKELHHKNCNQFSLCPVPVIETWLLNANTALTTAFEIIEKDNILNMIISKAGRDSCARTPAHIDPEK
jgi:hypothetical protein